MLPPKLNTIYRKRQHHEFLINNNIANKKHINNRIDTSKYNIITFLPKALLFQFIRIANIYFLITAIIQCIPEISPLNPITAIAPLCFVLIVSLIREGIEDVLRHKYDSLQNNELVHVYSPSDHCFVNSPSSSLHVGEIVLIEENKSFPADMILLDSNLDEGFAYVATGTLDGEKTLKIKNAYKTTCGIFHKEENSEAYDESFIISGEIMCDIPNANLFKFEGTAKIDFNNLHKQITNAYFPINLNQLLLKGAVLKQTKWIIGIVVYTGNNSKIILNSKSGVVKYSRIEKLMSKMLIAIFIFQFVLCLVCAIVHYFYYEPWQGYFSFVGMDMSELKKDSILMYFTYLLLLNTMIPISLIVTIEIVKGIQAYFITKDCLLYSFERQVFAKAGSITLNEELGNIDYIFSDKTGTLTCNKMMFKFCIIGKTCYEYIKNDDKDKDNNDKEKEKVRQSIYNDILLDKVKEKDDKALNTNNINTNYNLNNNGIPLNTNQNLLVQNTNNNNNELPCVNVLKSIKSISYSNNNNGQDRNNSKLLLLNDNSPMYKNINTLQINNNNILTINPRNSSRMNPSTPCNGKCKNIAIKPIGPLYMQEYVNNCQNPKKYTSFFIRSHQDKGTYLPITDDRVLINEFWKCLALAHECIYSDSEEEYSGVSPDDIELVKMAKEQGYQFLKSGNTFRRLLINNIETEYEVLYILPFTSERKRMSIIVKDHDIIKLYIKGADSEIIKRLSRHSKKAILNRCSTSVDQFSALGYRTLFIGMKILNLKEYETWRHQMEIAELSMENKNILIAECYNQIEANLYLIGATIVEDKLQDQVPETIRDLRLAGIKIWMLTGDKIDTAENIALSCNLITQNPHQMKNFRLVKDLQTNTAENTLIQKAISTEIERFFEEFQEFAYTEDNKSKNKLKPYSITIESSLFNNIFNDPELANQFLAIALDASSVICCRVSPLQKSQVVKAVKSFAKNCCTLAIGDGGNDVSMILEAHIGIGLYGEEGMRAVQASDIALGEFKYLRRLLFTHGRTNNIRISEMICYFFYKNFVLTIIHFYFSFYSLCSGQTIMDDWLISLYNMIFTALPLGVTAVTDFDIREEDNEITKKMMPFLYSENKQKPIFTKIRFLLILLAASIISYINFAIVANISYSPLDSDGHMAGLWETSISLFTNILMVVSERIIFVEKNHTLITPIIILITSFLSYLVVLILLHNGSTFNSYCAVMGAISNIKFFLSLLLLFTITFVMDMINYTIENLFSDDLISLLRTGNYSHKRVLEKMRIYEENGNSNAQQGMMIQLREMQTKENGWNIEETIGMSEMSVSSMNKIEILSNKGELFRHYSNVNVIQKNKGMMIQLTEKPCKYMSNNIMKGGNISYELNSNSKHCLVNHNNNKEEEEKKIGSCASVVHVIDIDHAA